MTDLTVDLIRFQDPKYAEATGIFIRATTPSGKWVSVDIAELERDSLIQFVRQRGPASPWAVSIVLILLGHDSADLVPQDPSLELVTSIPFLNKRLGKYDWDDDFGVKEFAIDLKKALGLQESS